MRWSLIPGLFGLTALLAGGVMLGRRLSRKAREKAWRAAPGRTPDNPFAVTQFDELDDMVHGTRCWCGGLLVPLSEGSVAGPEGTIRVAHAECVRCEADHHLYFDVSQIRH